MLTPQEVAKKSFAKARMGGYNMAMVDEFLDELTEDYTKLYEENAKLKAKLKVLVEKVEEYRSTEESMRAALFSAQKMATTIVEEAKAKSADIVTSAEAGAREEIARIRADVQKEEERLVFAKNEVAAFVAQWKEICKKQDEFLTQLPTLPVAKMEAKPAAAAVPAAPVEEEKPAAEETEERKQEITIEETIESILRETAAAEAAQEVEEEAPAAEEESVVEESAAEEIPSAEDVASLFETRRFRLDELQFGRNYDTK